MLLDKRVRTVKVTEGLVSKSGQKSQSVRWVGWVRLDININVNY